MSLSFIGPARACNLQARLKNILSLGVRRHGKCMYLGATNFVSRFMRFLPQNGTRLSSHPILFAQAQRTRLVLPAQEAGASARGPSRNALLCTFARISHSCNFLTEQSNLSAQKTYHKKPHNRARVTYKTGLLHFIRIQHFIRELSRYLEPISESVHSTR